MDIETRYNNKDNSEPKEEFVEFKVYLEGELISAIDELKRLGWKYIRLKEQPQNIKEENCCFNKESINIQKIQSTEEKGIEETLINQLKDK